MNCCNMWLFIRDCTKQSSGTEVHFNLEILVCVIMVCIMEYPKFTVSSQMEELISKESVNGLILL